MHWYRGLARGSELEFWKPWAWVRSPGKDREWKVSGFKWAPLALEKSVLQTSFHLQYILFMSGYQCITQMSFLQMESLPLSSKNWGLISHPPHWWGQAHDVVPRILPLKSYGSRFSASFCLCYLCGLGWVSYLPKPHFLFCSYEETEIENI